MSGSKKNRRARSGAKAVGASALVFGCALTAAIAFSAALIFALIFTAVAVRGEDPAKSASALGLGALAVCAFFAGVSASRVAKLPTPVCAAIGAAISAVALLLSFVPALPVVELPAPKLLCAAIPVVSALAGGAIAAPRRKRRRKTR